MGCVNAKRLGLVKQFGFSVVCDVRMTGQDPGELVVSDAQDAATGIDERVVVVVGIQDPVVTIGSH